MALLGILYPESFPYHPNWKAGLTHPAAITRSSVVDHVLPGAWGGDWNDDENLVTACWPCNGSKADSHSNSSAGRRSDQSPIPIGTA